MHLYCVTHGVQCKKQQLFARNLRRSSLYIFIIQETWTCKTEAHLLSMHSKMYIHTGIAEENNVKRTRI